MASTQKENHTILVQQRRQKFQWGVSQPPNQSQLSQQNIINQTHQDHQLENQPPSTKAKLNPNGLSFQDLPIKSSQIISGTNKKFMSNQSGVRQNLYTQRSQVSTDNQRGYSSRLNQLKNQFQILKGTLIDSRIVQHHKVSHQKAVNMSSSNNRISGANLQLKTGQSIRAKHRGGDKNKVIRKESLSSISQKDLNSVKVDHTQRYQKRTVFDHIFKKGHLNVENIHINQSKVHRSKVSSQNPRTERSKASQRLQKSVRPSGINANFTIQKHNLQVQLQNSLQKTQKLIQSQILLKTRVHELQQMIKRFLAPGSNSQQKITQRKIDQLNKKIQQAQARYEEQRQQNRELVQRVGRLEADIAGNEAILILLKQQKNQQINKAMEMKLNYANLQIDNKRLQMQKQMERKDLQYEVQILKNENQILKQNFTLKTGEKEYIREVPFTNFDKQKIRILQQELEQKDRLYKQAIQDLQNKKYLKQQKQILQMIQNAHKKRQEQSQGQISRELQKLKDQIVKIKNRSDLTQSQFQSQFGIQSKIISLQQALRRDNDEKDKNMIEIQKFQKQHEELKLRYRALLEQKQSLQEQNFKTNSKLKADLQQLESYKPKYQEIIKQNDNLNIKLAHLEAVIKNYQENQNQVSLLRETISRKQANHNKQLRDAKRRIDNAQFQAFKTQQQIKLNLDLNTRKLQSQIQILRNQLISLQQDRNFHRDQMNNLKHQNQNLILRLKEYEYNRDNRIKYETHLQIEQKQRVKSEHLQQIDQISKKFLSQQKRLVEQITGLTKLNEQLSQKLKRYLTLQGDNYQLKELCQRKISSEASIIHLWQIKQIQYSNINKILSIAKNQNAIFQMPHQNKNLAFSQLYTQNPERRRIIQTNFSPLPNPIQPSLNIPQNPQQISYRILQGPQQMQNPLNMKSPTQILHYRQGQPGKIIQNSQNIQFSQPNQVMQPLQIIKPDQLRQNILLNNTNQMLISPRLPKD